MLCLFEIPSSDVMEIHGTMEINEKKKASVLCASSLRLRTNRRARGNWKVGSCSLAQFRADVGDSKGVATLHHSRASKGIDSRTSEDEMRSTAELLETQSGRSQAMMDALLRRGSLTKTLVHPSARSGAEPLDDASTLKKKKLVPSSALYSERSALFPKTDAVRIADINGSRLRAEKMWGFPKPLVESECSHMTSLAVQMVRCGLFGLLRLASLN